MHSQRFFNLVIFKSFFIYRQLLFYSEAFVKVRFLGRTLPGILDTIARLQDVEPWAHNVQLMRAPPAIWSLQSLETSQWNWLGSEVADIEVDCFCPRSQVKNISFHFSSPLLTLFSWVFTMMVFLSLFIHVFALIWPGQIMPLFTYLRPLQRALANLQTMVGFAKILVTLWSFACHKLLPDFQCLSFSGTKSAPSILCQIS